VYSVFPALVSSAPTYCMVFSIIYQKSTVRHIKENALFIVAHHYRNRIDIIESILDIANGNEVSQIEI
jgi:hypothetical protein